MFSSRNNIITIFISAGAAHYSRFSNKLEYLDDRLDGKINVKSFNILEIGSYEGGWAIYVLNLLKNSNIDVVDTWSKDFSKGTSKDLSKGTLDSEIDFDSVENNFDKNLSSFGSRVAKFKGQSDQFFLKRGPFPLKELIKTIDCVGNFLLIITSMSGEPTLNI